MQDRESARYSQRALFFALLVSCLQPAISQTCAPGKTSSPNVATLTCGGTNCAGLPACSPSSGASSGIILDVSGLYQSTANCWWRLVASPGTNIRISFLFFDTRPTNDFVSIFQCDAASCSGLTQLFRQSGASSLNTNYTSTTGFAEIQIQASSLVNTAYQGFTALWSVEAEATLTCGGSNCGLGPCGDKLKAKSGTISDGVGNYMANANCWWLLSTASGNEITISFPTFSTESSYDFLTIQSCTFSALCTTNTQILRQSGSMSATNVYSSNTGFLKVIFTSDGDTQSSSFTGTWSVWDKCTSCTTGTYKSQTGAQNCTNCDAGKYSVSTGAIAESSCSSCPSNSVSTTGSDNLADCLCALGHTGPNGGPCEECPYDTYKPLGGDASCSPCPSNSGHSLTSHTNVTACVCNAGFTGPNGGPCVVASCAAGQYMSSVASGLSDLSGSIATSKLEEWTSAGFTLFKMGNGGQSCSSACSTSELQCHQFMISQQETAAIFESIGQTYGTLYLHGSEVSPICADGNCYWQGTTHTSQCSSNYESWARLCACGYGSPPGVPGSCQACPLYTNSPAASTGIQSCVCNAGYSGPDGGTCLACAAGKYKAATGSAACTDCAAGTHSASTGATTGSTCSACPELSSSVAGSTNSASCQCVTGSSGPAGGPCACNANQYADNNDLCCCDYQTLGYKMFDTPLSYSSGPTSIVGYNGWITCRDACAPKELCVGFVHNPDTQTCHLGGCLNGTGFECNIPSTIKSASSDLKNSR
jgi:hypothetical protein